jgi:cytochrome c5
MRAGALAAVATLVALGACGKPARPEDPAKVAARAAAMLPADARLAALYTSSCRNCHAHADSGAPATGYHYAWDPRWRQGLPVLLSHVIDGFQGMPAGGQCFACSANDFKALIRFMAGQTDRADTLRPS